MQRNEQHVMTCLHTWAIVTRDAQDKTVQNPTGVCGDAERAVQRVAEALREAAPGALGLVYTIPLNVHVNFEHLPGKLIRTGTLDPESGELHWDPPDAW